jgi:hypothetical protein
MLEARALNRLAEPDSSSLVNVFCLTSVSDADKAAAEDSEGDAGKPQSGERKRQVHKVVLQLQKRWAKLSLLPSL